MKIIDLLNKIANGEEVPKSFMYNDYIFNLGDDKRYRDNEDDYLSDSIRYDFENLNEEIKIIEDKKIERFKDYIPIGLTSMGADFRKQDVFEALMKIGDKINEIIDRLNKEK